MEEFGICAFYVPGRKDDGFRVTDKLSILAGPYDAQAPVARARTCSGICRGWWTCAHPSTGRR